jgi:hypothetical protein
MNRLDELKSSKDTRVAGKARAANTFLRDTFRTALENDGDSWLECRECTGKSLYPLLELCSWMQDFHRKQVLLLTNDVVVQERASASKVPYCSFTKFLDQLSIVAGEKNVVVHVLSEGGEAVLVTNKKY